MLNLNKLTSPVTALLLLLLAAQAHADCSPGDPLCPTLPAASPTMVPPPVPTGPSGKEKRTKFSAPSSTPAPSPRAPVQATPKRTSGQEPGYRETATPTRDGENQEIRFDDDAMSGRVLYGLQIKARGSADIKSCMNSVREIVESASSTQQNDQAIDFSKHPALKARLVAEYRKALSCIEPCRTEKDLDFLVGCAQLENIFKKSLDSPDVLVGQTIGCSGAQIKQAIKANLFDDRVTNDKGLCEKKVNTEIRTSGHEKNDVVLLIDNSISMESESVKIVPLIAQLVAAKAKEYGTNTNLVITSQVIGQPPKVIPVTHPRYRALVEETVKAFYDRSKSADDDFERPLLALKTNLPGNIRENAAVNIIVLTDEADSSLKLAAQGSEGGAVDSDKTAEAYVASLKTVTTGSLILNATEPDDEVASHSADPQPLHSAVRLTRGKNIPLTVESFKKHLGSILDKGQQKKLVLGPLPKNVVPETISVVWDGRELRNDEFRFNKTNHMIEPLFKFDPEARHDVAISYQVSDLEEQDESYLVNNGLSRRPPVPKIFKTIYSSLPAHLKEDLSWRINPDDLKPEFREEHRRFVKKYLSETLPSLKRKRGFVPPDEDSLFDWLKQAKAGTITYGDLHQGLDDEWLNRLFSSTWQKDLSEMLPALEASEEKRLDALMKHLSGFAQPLAGKVSWASSLSEQELLKLGFRLLLTDPRKCDFYVAQTISTWLEKSASLTAKDYPKVLESLRAFLRARHFSLSLECHSKFCEGKPTQKCRPNH